MKLIIDSKDSIRVVLQKQANKESLVDLPLYSDETELNKLDFTPTPETPKAPQIKVTRNSTWWKNFFLSTIYQFKP